MLHRLTEKPTRIDLGAPRTGRRIAARHKPSANVSRLVACAGATLVLLIAVPAPAQDYRAPAAAPPDADLPQGSTVPLPDGTRQHYVGPHFDAQGKYVPPHYEVPKPMQFRGYFPKDAAMREGQKQHGYDEPAPDYTTPDTTPEKPMEGR